MVIIVTPNKLAPDGMVGVSELVDRFYATVKKVMVRNDSQCKIIFISCLYVHFGQPDSYVSLFVYGFYFSQIHIIYCFVQVVMGRGCFDDTKVMLDTYSPLIFKILGANSCIHLLGMSLWFYAPGCCAD